MYGSGIPVMKQCMRLSRHNNDTTSRNNTNSSKTHQ